jgi:hypothetical protein
MPDLPPSTLHRARWRRARHWKARLVLLQHLITLVALVAVIAFIALCYHALTVYGARQGYGAPRGGEARVAIALFLGGGVVGGVAVYVVMAGRGRGGDD